LRTPTTVLIVEDSDDVRRLYALALGIEGFRVMEARDGLEALLLLDVDRPDVVVLDLDLPRISGHLVREELAAGAVTRDIPIVVVTGTAASPAELDVACLLRKPVSPDSLVYAVRKCLAAGARASNR
jgi:CheY-like chemotaxis protein